MYFLDYFLHLCSNYLLDFEMEKNDKIYVAGHNGMVGSAIVRLLQTQGYQNLVLRTSKELDLRNQAAVNAFFEIQKPEFVFLAAAKVGGILANSSYKADFLYDNLMIQSNVIAAAHQNGVKKLLFLGSSCIYPKLAPQPLKEEYLLTGELESTNDAYAIAKIAGIKLCEAYRNQHNANFVALMPTNLYGTNDNYDFKKSHVLPALIRKIYLGTCLEKNDWQAIRKNLEKYKNIDHQASQETIINELAKFGILFENKQVKIEIWGTGTPLREFLHVDDLAQASVFVMKSYAQAQFLNVGTGKDLTIKELAFLIKKITGFGGELFFDNSKPDGTPRKYLDVSRLENLGWKATISLEEGIKKVLSEIS